MTTTVPQPRVEVFFDLSGVADDFFTLDDPVRGLLDDTTYLLAGDVSTDVTDQVSYFRTSRGRMRSLDEFTAGSCEVLLRNESRDFDPNHATSPYVGNIRPGKRIELSAIGINIFVGKIRDWNLNYELGGISTATAIGTDALGDLGAMQFDEWTTTSQSAGDRIEAVLDRPEVLFGANRSIDDGIETLQADNVSHGSNVLNYLQLVARSDQGRLYSSRDGILTYQERTRALNSSALVFSDEGGLTIPYQSISLEHGREFLYNRVSVDRVGGTAQTVSNSDSQDEFGVESLTLNGLLLTTDGRSAELATYLLNLYSDPELRVVEVTVNMGAVFINLWESVLALDIGTLIRVVFTPNGVGDPIDLYALIEGISHEVRPEEHLVTFQLGAADTRTFFVLDDSTLGRLDAGNILAF